MFWDSILVLYFFSTPLSNQHLLVSIQSSEAVLAHLGCCTAGTLLSQIWNLLSDQGISWFSHLLVHSDISSLCSHRVGGTSKLCWVSLHEGRTLSTSPSLKGPSSSSSHMHFGGETYIQIHSKRTSVIFHSWQALARKEELVSMETWQGYPGPNQTPWIMSTEATWVLWDLENSEIASFAGVCSASVNVKWAFEGNT